MLYDTAKRQHTTPPPDILANKVRIAQNSSGSHASSASCTTCNLRDSRQYRGLHGGLCSAKGEVFSQQLIFGLFLCGFVVLILLHYRIVILFPAARWRHEPHQSPIRVHAVGTSSSTSCKFRWYLVMLQGACGGCTRCSQDFREFVQYSSTLQVGKQS